MKTKNRLRLTNGNVRETYFSSHQTGNIFVTRECRSGTNKRWMATGTQAADCDKAIEFKSHMSQK